MIDEGAKHSIDLWLWRIAALGRQRAFDHAQNAAANHSACVVVIQWRQAFAGQYKIERGNEIGRSIDQRTVEVESDGEHNTLDIRCDDASADECRKDPPLFGCKEQAEPRHFSC
jgi:hypothetical protein